MYKKLTRKDRRFLPKMQNILRSATRARAKLRPKTPRNLNFEFDHRHVPANFIQRDDIQWVDGKGVEQRIVICATTRQLKKLARTIRWEADATFSVVPKPFYQLFGIHTTVKKMVKSNQCHCYSRSCRVKPQSHM